MALRSLVETRDAETALQLFNSADHQQPGLVGPKSFQVLLTALKFSPAHIDSGLQRYRSALSDPVRFPQLDTNVLTAIGVLSLLLSAPTNPENLQRALAIKASLQSRGAKLDVGFYKHMLLLAEKYNDFFLAEQMYDEFKSSGSGAAVAIEAAFLKTAVTAQRVKVARRVYHNIVTDKQLGLIPDVVESMLRLCRATSNAHLCTTVVGAWLNQGGRLSWAMCEDIVALLMTPRLLQVATSPGYSGGSHTESTMPGARAVPAVVLDLAQDADKQLLAQVRVIHRVVREVSRALEFSAQHSDRTQLLGLSLSENEARAVVPFSLLPPLAVLITHVIESDALFVRLDSAHAQPSDARRREEHQIVVRKLARDLAVLGRWRALLSIRQRLEGYARASDPLHYDEHERREFLIWSLLALLRDRQFDKADRYISQLFGTAPQCRDLPALTAWLGRPSNLQEEFPEELRYVADKFAALSQATPGAEV